MHDISPAWRGQAHCSRCSWFYTLLQTSSEAPHLPYGFPLAADEQTPGDLLSRSTDSPGWAVGLHTETCESTARLAAAHSPAGPLCPGSAVGASAAVLGSDLPEQERQTVPPWKVGS